MFTDKYSRSSNQNKTPYRINNFKEKPLFRQPNEKKFVMNEIEFPSFLNNDVKLKTTTSNLSSMYVEKIKTEKEQPLEIEDNIQPGWVEIQYNPINNTKSIKYGKTIKKQHPIFIDVVEKLNLQYFLWKNNYIETWGKEEYAFLYNFPNYDYDYYDKLDEIWFEPEYTYEDEYE